MKTALACKGEAKASKWLGRGDWCRELISARDSIARLGVYTGLQGKSSLSFELCFGWNTCVHDAQTFVDCQDDKLDIRILQFPCSCKY